jgi:uncharacterized FAD-dependent dehydrogenase
MKWRELSPKKGIRFLRQINLATGHSARDIFELLDRKNIFIEAKAFAWALG